ncbi:MAG: GTPase domain-containing protein [Thiomargarita sp.]|nr:GTPase domain-containing protein [Thiomargarita sp.]
MNFNKKNNKKIYRFALYGLSGSGKTCLLTALAMPRIPHPKHYSCVWNQTNIPIDLSTIDTNQIHRLDEEDKQQVIKLLSQEWMKESIYQLSNASIPPTNSADDPTLTFEYDFTVSDHRSFRVELIDYSGQLIDPINDNKLAKQLRKQFIKMDGIIVLAQALSADETEQNEERQAQIYTNLHSLQQAFNLLRYEEQSLITLETPIVLLINKWDRYSDIEYSEPVLEQQKLETFLNSEPLAPHKALSDTLQFSTVAGRFKVFPVSPLGSSSYKQLEDGEIVEVPKQVNPLNSFGLEDPFIWLAQQRDLIDLEKLKQFSAANKIAKCRKLALDLLNRFSKEADETKQIEAILRVCQTRKQKYSIYSILFFIVLWFGGETLIDTINYHHYTDENTYTNTQELEQAKNWLTNYSNAPYFRHIISRNFLTQNKIQKILKQLSINHEIFLWESIENNIKINLNITRKVIQRYIKHYPTGLHIQEVNQAKQYIQQQELEQSSQELLSQLAQQFRRGKNDAQKLKYLLHKLNNTLLIQKMADMNETIYQQKNQLERHILAQQCLLKIRADKTLYQNIQTNPKLETIQQYLTTLPLKIMATEVLTYKKFLDKTHPDTIISGLQLNLVRILWNEVDDENNTIIVELNGRLLIYDKNVTAKPNTVVVMNKMGSRVFSAKPDESIKIKIQVFNEDIFFNDDYGSTIIEEQLFKLAGGYHVKLYDKKGVETGIVLIKIEGYPVKPKLPAWREGDWCVKNY